MAQVTAEYFISRVHLSDGRVANIADTTSGYLKFVRVNGVDIPVGNARDRLHLKINDNVIATNLIQIQETDVDGLIKNRDVLSVDQIMRVNGTDLVNRNVTRTSDGKSISVMNQVITVNGSPVINKRDTGTGNTNMELDFQVNGVTVENTPFPSLNPTKHIINQKVFINDKQLNNDNSEIRTHFKIDGDEHKDLKITDTDTVIIPKASISNYGAIQLSNAIDSDSEIYAATSKAVKNVQTNLEEAQEKLEQDLEDYKEEMTKKTTIADYGITDAKIEYDEEGAPTITLGKETITPITSEHGNIPLAHVDDANELKKIEEAAEAGGDGLLQRIAPAGDWVFTTAAGTGTIQAVTVNGKLIASEGTADIPAATTEEYGATILVSHMEHGNETKAINSKVLDNYIILSDTEPTSKVQGEFWYEILPDEEEE